MSGSNGGSGTASSGSSAVPDHRPLPVACPPSSTGPGPAAKACTKDADCVGDSGYVFARFCLNHGCSADQCLADSDCTGGAVCGCANQFGGNAIHTNACVPSTCRVDADCASMLCSQARTGYCGSLAGYHCRSAADTCRTDADCASIKSGDAGFTLPSQCSYEPTVGHWQCAPATVCMG